MINKITTDDLILYYYNETQLTENVLIQREIDHNPETEEEFENIKEAACFLNRLLEKSSSQRIERIMEYAVSLYN